MPKIPLLITPKWKSRPAILPIPGYGVVRRPNIGAYYYVESELALTWLLANNYCVAAPDFPYTPPVPGNNVEPIPEEPVQHTVYVDQNSELQLDPAVRTSVPGNGEEVLLNFFREKEPAEINAAIRPISLKMAQEIKQADPLDWLAVCRILSDRAMDAAAKWATAQQA
jgi:hypothetical protein